MKRLSAVLAIGLFFSFCCFAQTQEGDASYNASKTGFTLSHSSLSFNTRVRVTNLKNNQSVEATVNGRIPISAERIVDIARDAGDALGMLSTGMTPVRIEILPFRQSVPEPVQVPETPAEPAPEPAPRPPVAQPPAPAPASPSTAPQPVVVQTITEPQYIPVPTPYPAAPCGNIPLLIVIICLLSLVVALLGVMLFVLLRRRRHPVWLRRHYWYAKKHRI